MFVAAVIQIARMPAGILQIPAFTNSRIYGDLLPVGFAYQTVHRLAE
jgi:hypothetical protein